MGCVIHTPHGLKHINYQDIWFNGRPLVRGGRECEFRYYAIEKYLKKFKRPISVLDIGANMGYFSMRLMEVFRGTFVMVEGDEFTANVLLRLCKLNDNRQAVLLKRRFNLADLIALSETAHFDVVFALSVVHHFQEPYQQVFEALANLGSVLIFEPPSLDENTLNQERINKEPLDLSKYEKKMLVRTLTKSVVSKNIYRETYAISCKQKKVLKKPYFRATRPFSQEIAINANFKERTAFLPRTNQEVNWPVGLNFNTFMALNGIYPQRQRILSMLQELKLRDDENISPGELILTGDQLIRLSSYFDSREIEQFGDPRTLSAMREDLISYLPA